jgi:membrane protease YdiL (CAAX protease family)
VKLWRSIAVTLARLKSEPTTIVCGASAVLVVSHSQGSVGYLRSLWNYDALPAAGAMGYFWWFGTSVLFYLVVPLLLSVATKGSFHRKYGLGLGRWREGLKLSALFLAIMLPAVVVASRFEGFKGMYPLAGGGAFLLNHDGKQEPSRLLFAAYEAAYFAYFVGWEFLFRGWMLNGLLKHWGRAAALLVQVAPFAIMHLGKAEPEALGSIIAGVALGLLALRTRSFWYGAVLHGVIASFMDCLQVYGSL